MKINNVLLLITIVISALLGIWVYSIAEIDSHALLAGVFSTICFAIPLIMGLCISYSTSAMIVNIRTISLVFLVIMLVSHFYNASKGITMPSYIITNGIFICIYAAIVYAIVKSKQ